MANYWRRIYRSATLLIFSLSPLLLFSLSNAAELFPTYPIPQDFGYPRTFDYLLDAGVGWKFNRLSHPLALPTDGVSISELWGETTLGWIGARIDRLNGRLPVPSDTSRALGVRMLAGVEVRSELGDGRAYDNVSFAPFHYTEGLAKGGFYGRVYVRDTNEAGALPHYSGREQGIARGGLRSLEFDQAALGYRNRIAKVEFGRGRQIWGPRPDENLVLAGSSPPYDRLEVELEYKRISVRFFAGFLEAMIDSSTGVKDTATRVQRYISGRMIEYRPIETLLLGAGEVSIFAGPDRPFDLNFLNPLALHLEIDQNKRSNDINADRNNSIWFAHLDWLLWQKLRLSGSFLLDEFQLDEGDRKEGRVDNLGYYARIAFTPITLPNWLATVYTEWTRINTYTLQHDYYYCNFVTRSELLGNPIGNDADQMLGGIRIIQRVPLIVALEIGRLRRGENSLVYQPYSDFDQINSVPFPSGRISREDFIHAHIDLLPHDRFALTLDMTSVFAKSGPNSLGDRYSFEFRYIFPLLNRKF